MDTFLPYRSHYAFLGDCLDAYVAGACLHLLGMENVDSEPSRKQMFFEILSPEEKYGFLHQIAKEILDKYINLDEGNKNKIK